MRLLMPFDGSEPAARALAHAITLIQRAGGGEVHLLNVQEPVDAPELRSHMTVAEIEAMQEARGGDILAPARRQLTDAGVACVPAVVLGPVARTIARYAEAKECEQIVMGTRGLGAVASVLIGSVTAEVADLTDRPLTLIK